MVVSMPHARRKQCPLRVLTYMSAPSNLLIRTRPPPSDSPLYHAPSSTVTTVISNHPDRSSLTLTSQSAQYFPAFPPRPANGLGFPSPPPSVFPANTGHASRSCGPSHSSHRSVFAVWIDEVRECVGSLGTDEPGSPFDWLRNLVRLHSSSVRRVSSSSSR